MKKIDLHIHTIASISDSPFFFSLNALEDYVKKLEIDCIAVTNHNIFDKNQFEEICQKLSIKVFPGIEINLEGGHLLLISENEELEDFGLKCSRINNLIKKKEDSITFEQLSEVFPLLNKYLLIPHYEKKPNIKKETLQKLGDNVFAGEVTSLRKFKTCIKEADRLVPVIFSDCRFTENMEQFSTRQTYIDAEESSLRAIKGCLFDKAKVFLSKEEGNDFFQATDDGIVLSTGLNVVIGERSSGKTYTLNKISRSYNGKYLKQFSLLQNDEEKFKDLVTTRHSLVSESYLKELKDIIYEINEIDLVANNIKIAKYLESLKKYATENDKLDAFSKCRLYNEVNFEIDDVENLKKLISATRLLIDNIEYKTIINKHISDEILKSLLLDLISNHNRIHYENLKKNWINDLINEIKNDLRFRSTTTIIEEVDFSKVQLDKIKVDKFKKVVKSIQTERDIDSKEIRGFKVVARTKKYTGASQLKAKSKRQLAFSEAYNNYNDPYKFLISLKNIGGIEETDYHKYFVDIEYKTLNKYGFEVSGGERSEFNLLHEISDALKYDMLLIDEPESSFDNIFLKNEVNELIKEISREIPVVVVTHNNTVGASIKPDFLLYTQKIVNDEEVQYNVYFGCPTSKTLKNSRGEEIQNWEILLNCLEAGSEACYERKNKAYEILKN